MSAGDLAERFDMSRPAVSQHLRVLREAGLVRVRSEGTRRYYAAAHGELERLRRGLDGFWPSDPVRRKRRPPRSRR